MTSKSISEVWKEWKRVNNKSYNNRSEKKHAKSTWKINHEFIQKHNAEFKKGQQTFLLGHNKYSDLDENEFVNIKGLETNQQLESEGSSECQLQSCSLPDHVDWRKEGMVNPVQDQGRFGCCYAFSAVTAIEAQHFKKTGKLVKFSEQNVVDCSSKFGNRGGQGGSMNNVFKYVKANGIDTQSNYPYEATTGSCRFKPESSAATISDYREIPRGDEQALTKAVATVGPVCIGVNTSQRTFHLYKSGIYHDVNCSKTPDHAMVVVGYGSDGPGQDYYIVRNSWGTSWGDEGYIKMARNRDNAAGIAYMGSYPIIHEASGGESNDISAS